MQRSKYKKVVDLYQLGTEVVFEDGTVMYLQAMNPFEVDEARYAASVAKARLALTVKHVGSEEYDLVLSNVEANGSESAINDLIANRTNETFLKALAEVQDDDDWKERWSIIDRSSDIDKLPEGHPERDMLAAITEEFFAEVTLRRDNLLDSYRYDLDQLTVDELIDAYADEWINKRGQARALDAYNVIEILMGARCCEAVKPNVGEPFNHHNCDHSVTAFESIEEVQSLPKEMFQIIREGFDRTSMSVREAKN